VEEEAVAVEVVVEVEHQWNLYLEVEEVVVVELHHSCLLPQISLLVDLTLLVLLLMD
jgi:hypothetical protein